MITIKDAEEILKKEYVRDNYEYLLKEILLPDFTIDRHPVEYDGELFSKVDFLGESSQCNVSIFEVLLAPNAHNQRVAITQEMFKILRGLHINNAVVSFVNDDFNNYRLSLLTSKYEFDGKKIVRIISNPRRFSYSLGFGTKTKTAYKYLIEKGRVNSLSELIQRFSVEVVNKQFYSEIALAFTKLVGGELNGVTYDAMLNLHILYDHIAYSEFSVRLIGRIMFCWFLKEKKSATGIPLVHEDLFSVKKVKEAKNYYHDTLEPLFFEILNTSQVVRKKCFQTEYYSQIPYLNGGLFSPHDDDYYEFDRENNRGSYDGAVIPNEWFESFYSVLSDYNFTVDENTAYDIELSIDPEMLGRIFENLLAEINPETGENAKKNTGSFYTPRDIVDYMVDSSLCEYLKNKTNVSEEKLKAIISYTKEDDEGLVFTAKEKKQIVDALYTITVLDPACGSGAFPIGMLQKIVYILQEIDSDANLWFDKATENVSIFLKKEFEKKFNDGSLNYIRKLSVIQNSVFGIDIQPIAVEISRLRCFLSLIIEEKVDDSEENRGVNPLPNLDFKFIIANSLIPIEKLAKGERQNMTLFENLDYIRKLKDVRDEYFNADNSRRSELKLEFLNIQNDMLRERIKLHAYSTEKYEQLYSWKPFSNGSTDWFDPDWMFGIKDGFDIVIGNPPYVQLQKTIDEAANTKLGDLYVACKYETFARTGDIYCLFYEKGLKLLKENGILCYITSNKWMRAGYGEKLRAYFAKNADPILLVDFAGQKIFESATVDTNILLMSNSDNRHETKACIAKDGCKDNMSVYIEQNSSINDFDTSDSWTLLSPLEQSIKRKIESVGIPLKDWDISINYGIKTGYNDAFIISGKKKDELIAEDPKSAEIIRPILRGKDIKRYKAEFADLWLIASHNGNRSTRTMRIDIADYPAIKKHLDQFYDKIEKRDDQGDTPYNLRNCAYMDDFSKQKIVWARLSRISKNDFDDFPRFAIVDPGYFVVDSLCFFTGRNLSNLVKVLNSEFAAYYFFKNVAILDAGGMQMRQQYVENIPLPSNLESLFFEDRDIDQVIYDAFGFDQTEVAFIKSFLMQKKKEITNR